MRTLITLSPYKNFKCTASACTDNCCVGWQISIDNKSIKKYREYSGAFKNELINGIDFNTKTFKQNKLKRCAFLSDNNLCKLISAIGEDCLCQVCRDHPRFKNFFGDRIETGIGLSCPEGAKELLFYNDKITEKVIKKGKGILSTQEKKIIAFRKKCIKITQDRKLSVKERIENLLSVCNLSANTFLSKDYKKLFLSTERLNADFNGRVADIKSLDIKKSFYVPFEQLLVYFIYRYVSRAIDGLDLKSRLLFCIISALEICFSANSENDIVKSAVEYSKEIEYDALNVENILNFTDQMCLFAENTGKNL